MSLTLLTHCSDPSPRSPTPAQVPVAIPTSAETTALQIAFSLSFSFDSCGDIQTGALFRQAIMEKLDHCPFSEEAKARFWARAATDEVRANDAIRQYVEQHGSLPERLPGMKHSCKEELETVQTSFGGKLASYAHHQISAEAIVPGPCSPSAGSL